MGEGKSTCVEVCSAVLVPESYGSFVDPYGDMVLRRESMRDLRFRLASAAEKYELPGEAGDCGRSSAVTDALAGSSAIVSAPCACTFQQAFHPQGLESDLQSSFSFGQPSRCAEVQVVGVSWTHH